MLGNVPDVVPQFHDRDVEIFEIPFRPSQEPMGLFGLEAPSLRVVGDPVQRVHRLVVVVSPATHLTLELRNGAPVDDYRGVKPIGIDTFCRELDQNSHELGDAEVLALGKVDCAALLIRGEPHVDVLAVFAHLYSFASGQANVEGACHLGARGIPRKAVAIRPAAAYRSGPSLQQPQKLLEGSRSRPASDRALCWALVRTT